MNKTTIAAVSAVALVYAGLCFFATLQYYVTTEGHPVHLFLFFPTSMEHLGYDLTDNLMIGNGWVETVFDAVLGFLPASLAGYRFYIELLMLLFGFMIAALGFMSKTVNNCAGTENPAQYLWTHRPNAFLKCLLLPWGILVGCWNKKKVLVILPLLVIFIYAPWSLMIDVYLILPFLIAKLVISGKIAAHARAEADEYERNTDYGVCPECKRTFERPMVKCRCGLILEYPVPNQYGYKYHTCNRGHENPCESGKRGNLTTNCPHCKAQIQTREALPITISIVGGLGTGKTSLMLAAVKTIMQRARLVDITVDSPSTGLSKDAIVAKDYVPKTVQGELESQTLFIRSRKLQDREIIFNDISGAEFQPSINKVIFQEYYNYTNGIIFTFDPLLLSRDHQRDLPHEVFESFHYMYTTVRNYGPGTVSDMPFAIVATKSDLTSPRMRDDDVRQFLIDNGEESLVLVVESLFTEVRYFSVCSYGEDCESAMRPVWWIVDHVDQTITELIPSP